MTTIITKKGKGAPASDNLDVAELALDVETGSLYTKLEDLSVHEISASSGSGGTGSSVHIGDIPPADPQEGQQWMEVPATGEAVMWIYDGEKWLQSPGGKDGQNGADGADGVDGADGLWEANGDDIYYNDGNVGIGENNPNAKLHVDNGGSGDLMNLTGQLGSITSNKFGNALSFSRPDSNYISASGIGANLQISAQSFLRFETNGSEAMRIDADGRVDITGSLYVNGTPKIGYSELITTLTTLRNATQDETTLEGLRDSIGNAIGGLIEEFENQIATMPAGDES